MGGRGARRNPRHGDATMVRLIVLAALVAALAGCQQQTPEQRQAAEVIAEVQQHAAKASAAMAAEDDAAAKALADLQANPQKLKDFALDAARKAMAKLYGSERAEAATITADRVEEYGGERWKVIGALDAVDDEGERHQTEWEADLQFMFGKLQCRSVKLER